MNKKKSQLDTTLYPTQFLKLHLCEICRSLKQNLHKHAYKFSTGSHKQTIRTNMLVNILFTFSFSFNQKFRPFTANHTPNTSEIARKETKRMEEPISDQRDKQRQLSFSNVTMEGQTTFAIYEVNSLTIN